MSLPAELIVAIARQFPQRDYGRTTFQNVDLRSMRLVCKTWASALGPVLHQRSAVSLKSAEQIERFLKEGEVFLRQIHHLKFGISGYSPSKPAPISKWRTYHWYTAVPIPRCIMLPVVAACSSLCTFSASLDPSDRTPNATKQLLQDLQASRLDKVALDQGPCNKSKETVESLVDILCCFPSITVLTIITEFDPLAQGFDDERYYDTDSPFYNTAKGATLPNLRTLSWYGTGEVGGFPTSLLAHILDKETLLGITNLTVFEPDTLLRHRKMCLLLPNVEELKISGYGLGYEGLDESSFSLSDFGRFKRLRSLSFDPGASVWPFVTLSTVFSCALPSNVERIEFNVDFQDDDDDNGATVPKVDLDRLRASALREVIMYDLTHQYAFFDKDEKANRKAVKICRDLQAAVSPLGVKVRLRDEAFKELLE